MKNKIKILGVASLLIIFLETIIFPMPLVQPTAMYPQVEPGVQYTIGEFVFDDNFDPIPDDCCNITIRYPSGAIYVEDVSMVNYSDGWHEYNVTLTTPGFYRALMWCNCSSDYASIDKSFIVGPSFDTLNNTLNFINGTANYLNNTFLSGIESKIDAIYSLSQQISNNITYINNTRWGAYTALDLYNHIHDIYKISYYLNNTIWAGYIADDLYHISNLTHTIAGFINSTVQSIDTNVDQILTIVNYINQTVNTLEVDLGYVNATVNNMESVVGFINITTTHINTSSQVAINNTLNHINTTMNLVNTLVGNINTTIGYVNLTVDYINVTRWGNVTAYDLFHLSNMTYHLADAIENIVLNINTTTNSIGDAFTVSLTNFGEINPGSDYLAQVTIFDSDGTMMNADAAPVISLYDPSGNLIVNDIPMTWIGTGQYAYSYTTAGGQPSGQWTTITKTTVSGNIVKNIEYWELESNPPEVTLSVIDACFPAIGAEISITNEGTGNQEYIYYWWITPRADGEFADVDTVDSSSASKLVAPLDTFTTEKILSVPIIGTYWYKTKVYWGTEWSAASAQFDAVNCGGGSGVTPIPGMRKELTIKVVDDNWNPIQGVMASVYDDERLLGTGITNETGVALFGVPSMTIRVTVSKDGYVPTEKTITITGSTTEIIQMQPIGFGGFPWILLILLIIGGIVTYYTYKKQKTGHKKKRTA